MKISATIKNSYQQNDISLETNGSAKTIVIPFKPEGFGSSVNGGELLLLSLATCFCNDVYREAMKRSIQIESVEVAVTGSFAAEGEPANEISYEANVQSPTATAGEIKDLLAYVDTIAEVHNTLRKGIALSLKQS